MNPHKKTLTDETSGIEYENQRYLDYQDGIREVVEDIVKELDNPFATPKWRILEQVEVCIGGWQAKLKE